MNKNLTMDQLPKKIETKTSPFSLPKSTINSIQTKNVKTLKFSTDREPNLFYIFIGIFIVFASGVIVYVLLSLSQLQKLAENNASSTTNTITPNIVEVSNEEVILIQTPWASKEVKINNNVVWHLQLPSSFIETSIDAADGTNIFIGEDGFNKYKLLLSFPLFANYPEGEPEDLAEWIQKELTFLTPEKSLEVTSESFTLNNNVSATLLMNMNEITADSGNARIFGTKKSLVLYIAKTKTRNFSKITLIPQELYSEESAKAFMERLASSIRF